MLAAAAEESVVVVLVYRLGSVLLEHGLAGISLLLLRTGGLWILLLILLLLILVWLLMAIEVCIGIHLEGSEGVENGKCMRKLERKVRGLMKVHVCCWRSSFNGNGKHDLR
jgi:hypothetical protein